MAKAAIAYLNLSDAGTLTASTQVLTLPVANLQNAHVQRRWRSTANSGNFVNDLGGSKSIDTIGVFGMTMTASGTIRIRLSTVDATGAAGDAYDSGTLSVDTNYNAFVALVTSPVSARYVRVDLSDSPSTYVEAGRLFVGLRTALTFNFSYNWQKAIVDRSIRTKTRGGQTQIFLDNHYRSIDLTFASLTTAERNALIESVDLTNGLSTDILFVVDTASTNLARDSIWGLISDSTAVVQSYFSTFSKQYKIEERL